MNEYTKLPFDPPSFWEMILILALMLIVLYAISILGR